MKRFVHCNVILSLLLFVHPSLALAKYYTPGQSFRTWQGSYSATGGSITSCYAENLKPPTCTDGNCSYPSEMYIYGTEATSTNCKVPPTFAIYTCRKDSTDTYSFIGKTIPSSYVKIGFVDNIDAIYPYDSDPYSKVCGPPSCQSKVGQKLYDLKLYHPGETGVTGTSCYEDCQTTSVALWTDCLASSCVASLEFTYTGQSCSTEPTVSDLDESPPDRCTEELNAKIAQCGGSLNVSSFDFTTCTGTCVPDPCQDKWNALLERCGGIMAITGWDAQACTGQCVSDPVPATPQTDYNPPETITNETVTNSDGSKEVTQNVTSTQNGYTYTNSTTTYYNSSGTQTGQKTSTTITPSSSDNADDETFSAISPSGFSDQYNPGEYDIPARFTTFLNRVKSTGLFSFSADFFNSLPGGGSPVYEIEAGQYGHHTIDLSQTLTTGLAILKTILLACFGFLSIRAVIMKR